MKVKLLVWAKSKFHNGNRDTADTVIELEGETKNATAAARLADKGKIPEGFVFTGKEIDRLAVGHGVTVIYPNGRKKEVSYKDA